MDKKVLQQAELYARRKRRKKAWKKIMSVLGFAVVFVTTYALILPAITMEQEVSCGIEEHLHNETCYETVLTEQESAELICAPEVHSHTEACYDEEGELICGLSDRLVHAHDESCYFNGELICPLPEVEEHIHTEACYTTYEVLICEREEIQHIHSDDCWLIERGELLCQLEEGVDHTHTDACFEQVETLICQAVENQHVHGTDCYQTVCELSCGLDQIVVHTHEESCYDENGVLICEYLAAEEHVHSGNCLRISVDTVPTEVLICTLEEHTHTEICMEYPAGLEIFPPDEESEVDEDPECTETPEGDEPEEVSPPEEESETVEAPNFIEAPEGGETEEVLPPEEESEPVEAPNFIEAPEGGETEEVLPPEEESEPVEVPDFIEAPEEDGTAESEPEEAEIDWDRIADVSNGPVVSVYITPAEDETAEELILQSSTLSLSSIAVQTTAETDTTVRDLQEYIDEQNAAQPDETKHASISFRLIDPTTEQTVPENEDGTYSVVAGQSYIFSLDVVLPSGIHPGTYMYSLPEGVYTSGGSGAIVTVDGVALGEYSVDTEGNITLTIYDTTDAHSQITILADVAIQFSETSESVVFDGGITVVITKPPDTEETEQTEVYKTASSDNGGPFVDCDGDGVVDLIHWTGNIQGSANSSIVGSTLTDSIGYSQKMHHYDALSMSYGITFTFTDDNGATHQWTVTAGDSNLSWSSTGWSYTFPERITCSICNETISLENTYTYRFSYYSSINPDILVNGALVNETVFSNKIEIDNAEDQEWYTYTDGSYDIVKSGKYNSETMEFEWSVDATIPGYNGSGAPMGYWCIEDYMDIVVDSWDLETNEKAHNAMDVGTVTARYIKDGETVTESVPNISEADGTSRFAYKIVQTLTTTDESEVSYGHWIILLSRCDCTEDSCANWVDGTCHGHTVEKGYCSCWTVPESVHFVFEYSHSNSELIGEYGGSTLRNTVFLYRGQLQADGSFSHNWTDYDDAHIKIPGLFNKAKLDSDNEYIAKFEITVNEQRLDLSGHEKLEIVDTMSPTLDYIAGTLTIWTWDGSATGVLVEGEDFSVSYNATTHVMTITIHDPGQMMYVLRYDTEINVSNAVDGSYIYHNSAEITLFGISISSDTDTTEITGLTAVSKQYVVNLHKVDAADNTVAVAGATLGLFDAYGNKLFEGVTDENGCLDFVTSVTAGTLLYEHTLYYIKEIAPPDGYKLSADEHWFYFCNGLSEGAEETCTHEGCVNNTLGAEHNAKKMPGDDISIQIVNEREYDYVLPETGGAGTHLYTLGGLLLMAVGVLLLYGPVRRRKEEHPSS